MGKFLTKGYHNKGYLTYLNETAKIKEKEENAKKIKQEEEEKKKKEENKTINENRINRIISETTANKLRSEAYVLLYENYFLNGLSETFAYTVNSILEENPMFNIDSYKRYFKSILIENGVNMSALIRDTKNNNRYLSTLFETAKTLAAKNADKYVQNNDELTQEKIDDFVNNNNDDIDKDINNDYNDEEVREVLKNKVIETIKSEKEYAKQVKEQDEQIKQAKELNENNVNIIPMGEEQYSLFKSLIITSQKLNENVDLDNSLAEAIIEYTRLELFNTLNITNHNITDVSNMCSRLITKPNTTIVM